MNVTVLSMHLASWNVPVHFSVTSAPSMIFKDNLSSSVRVIAAIVDLSGAFAMALLLLLAGYAATAPIY